LASPIDETVVLNPENAAAAPAPAVSSAPAPVAAAPAPVAPAAPAPAPGAVGGEGVITQHKNPDGSITTITSYKGPLPNSALHNPFFGN